MNSIIEINKQIIYFILKSVKYVPNNHNCSAVLSLKITYKILFGIGEDLWEFGITTINNTSPVQKLFKLKNENRHKPF